MLANALRAGRLSPEQARLVSDAVAADPVAEQRLVHQATRASLGELRDACHRVKAAADPDRDSTHKRIRASRRLRRWTDEEGGWNFTGRTVAEDGAEINAAVKDIADDLFAKARTVGRRDPHEASLIDALVEVTRRHNRRTHQSAPTSTPTRQHQPGYLGLVRVDVEALRRGAVEGDELCEIAGIGPVPVHTARALLGDAVVKLVVTRGTDVMNVTHLGRGPTVAQRCALLWKDPRCTAEGCPRLWREADHRVDWAQTHHTRLDELDGLCEHHHDLPDPQVRRPRW